MKALLFSNTIFCRQATYICFTLLSICLFTSSVFAQSTHLPEKELSKDICPVFNTTGPASVGYGVPLEFSVTFVDEKDNEKYVYRWTVSQGEIVEGQGTNHIKVKVEGGGFIVTATVEIDGLPSGCERTSSASTDTGGCGGMPPISAKVSEGVFINKASLKEQLYDFVIRLMSDPTASAYIVLYFDKKTSLAKLKQLITVVRNELIEREISSDRITIIDKAGNKKLSFEFWVIPSGASPPYPF